MKVYDASEVTVNFAGLAIESGFAEGEFCRIEQEEADFVHKVGTDGEVTRSKTNNRVTKVTILLMQSSEGNNKLSTLNNIDRLANNGAGVAPILVRDRQGMSVFAAAEAWIEGPPKASYGKEAGPREWVIVAANPDRFDGGN